MTLVLQTRVATTTQVNKSTVASVDDTVKPENAGMTKEGFIAVLESSNFAEDLLIILNEQYFLVPKDHGGAVGTILDWLGDNVESFSPSVIEGIETGLGKEGALTLALSLIDPRFIRAGVLDRRHTLTLIGESSNAKKH